MNDPLASLASSRPRPPRRTPDGLTAARNCQRLARERTGLVGPLPRWQKRKKERGRRGENKKRSIALPRRTRGKMVTATMWRQGGGTTTKGCEANGNITRDIVGLNSGIGITLGLGPLLGLIGPESRVLTPMLTEKYLT